MAGKEYDEIPVTTLASGYQLALPVHRVTGDRPGPCLGMTALLHGDETLPNAVFRRVLEELDPSDVNGTLLMIPVANPLAYEALSRNTPLDMTNMNRVFPGSPGGWFTEQMAHAIVTEFIPKIEYLLDWHAGSGGTFPTVDYVLRSRLDPDMAAAFGMYILYDGGLPGSLASYAEAHNIPTVILEVGGGSLQEQKYLEMGVRGTYNVMKYLGMLKGEPQVPDRQILIKDRVTIRTRAGGVFYPEIGLDQMCKVVPGGTVLGRVISPYTFEELEVIRAPFNESLIFLLFGAIARIHSGETAYMIADAETAEFVDNASRWRAM
jgi:predicted deacylase